MKCVNWSHDTGTIVGSMMGHPGPERKSLKEDHDMCSAAGTINLISIRKWLYKAKFVMKECKWRIRLH